MMNNQRKVAAGLAVLLAVSLWSSAGRSQDQRGRAADGSSVGMVKRAAQKQPAKMGRMGVEEKLVRDVYARLMRYQSAAKDEQAETSGAPAKPEDYLTYGLRNIRTGAVADIAERPLGEFVTGRSGAIINITPKHLSAAKGAAHAYYEAEWAQLPAAVEGQVAGLTVGDMLRRDEKRFAGVERYASYEVFVTLGGRQRAYKAIALLRGPSREAHQPSAEIIDHITSEMNTVFSETAPRLRSPWKKYSKSTLALAVARSIREARETGRPLIPTDAPIGYLPGDDAKTDTGDTLASKFDDARMLAEVTSVNYIERVLAPWSTAWGAMRPTTWTVDIEVRFNCTNNRWYAVVSRADSEYDIFYRLLSGVTEATVAAATNANHCKMISDLNALGNVTNVQWYMVAAVEAHERVHVTEWRSSLNPEFATMKSTIEGLSVANTAGMTSGDAIAQIKAMPAYTNAVSGANTRARTTFFAIADPNAQTNAAEHAVVDPMITSIRQRAASQGWAACPP